MKVNRILTVIVLLLFLFSNSYAQKKDTPWYKKTLSDFCSVYFGFSNEMGSFHNAESNFWGFDIGMYLFPFKGKAKNTAFLVGMGGTWLDNSINVNLPVADRNLSYPLNVKIGGIRLGILFFWNALFNPSLDVLLAAGDIRYQVPDNLFAKYKNYIEKQTVPIYVVMPKLNLEIKITNYMKFGLGLSYRIVKGIAVSWSSNSYASGFGYHGTFKFGNFGK